MTKNSASPLLRIFSLFSLLCVSGPLVLADASGRDVDHDVHIAVIEHEMAFDKTEFSVAAGSTVRIHFTNTDGMIHNIIVASKQGGEAVYMEIGQQVLDLGADAVARDFVPDSDLVLAYSKALQPGESDTFVFIAPEELGSYPYVCSIPGHPSTMNGIMHVTADGTAPLGSAAQRRSGFSELHYRYYEGIWNQLPDFDELTPVSEGRTPNDMITLDPRQQDDYFGFVFHGKLEVEESGEYGFMMRSDDGSRLYINDQMVIDHDGLHGDGEIKIGEKHIDAGFHDVRVEYFEHTVAFNLVLDWVGPSGERLPRLTEHDRISDVRRFIVEVEDEPQVWRVLLPDTSPRSIAVGLPENISYCFNPETLSVSYAWHGAFINRGAMIGQGQGRGPQPVDILGSRFPIGTVDRPLRIGDATVQPDVRFLGVRRTGEDVAFLYETDGHRVTQRIEAAPGRDKGLRYHFEFAEIPVAPVHFLVDDSELTLSSSAGYWNGNVLTVPAEDARRFSVTVINPNL